MISATISPAIGAQPAGHIARLARDDQSANGRRGAQGDRVPDICSGLAFFGYGEIYSLFPATSADLFGRTYATTNYGLLYTSKGLASLLIPVGAIIQQATNSWTPVFATAVVFDVIAATLAFVVLRRLAAAHRARSAMTAQAPAMVPAVAGGSE